MEESSTNKPSGQSRMLTKVLRLALFGVLFLGVIFTGIYAWVYSTVPSRNSFHNLKNYTSSEVYSSDGQLLGKYFLQDRTNVKLENISSNIVNALLATEDVRFYEHNGIDKRGLLRVLFKTILLGNDESGGGSTITQQLAKNLFPRKSFPLFSLPLNKLREFITAEKLEDVFTKDEILVLYLNTVPFGENAFGIEVASRRYFSKSANSLNLQEAATLVGMLKATTTFNPRKHPEASRNRRNVVLSQMEKYEFLTKKVSDSLKALPLEINYKFIDHNRGLATYFREHLRQELLEWCENNRKEDGTPYNLYTDGLKIYTSIDSKMQVYAEKAVITHMARLQKQFQDHWGRSNPWGKDRSVLEDAKRRSTRYRRLKADGFSEEEINKIFAQEVETKLFSYKGDKTVSISPNDSLKYYLKFLHAGFMVMDPHSAEIKAWVGGLNHEHFKYDHVNTSSRRQVGSTFKPIVYAAALEEGLSPCDYFPNEKYQYEEYDNWTPGNADGKYGGEYSMKGALTNSVNTVSAQLIMKAGIENVVELAKRMGISSNLEEVPSLALGTADISLFEMVSAYTVFPNGGIHKKPRYLLRIETADGKVLEDFSNTRPEQEIALSEESASLMVNMMQNVVNEGTGKRLRYQYRLTLPLAGKTGTTQGHADGWFLGYTPDLVAGAWVGGEDRRIHFRSIALGQGANMALPIYGEFMTLLLKDPKFQYLKRSKFSRLDKDLTRELDCDYYKPPVDTTTFWYKLFGRKNQEEFSGDTSIYQPDEMDRRRQPSTYRSSKPQPRKPKKKQYSIWDMFKKK